MKARIIAMGHRMPSWVRDASEEYLKRMPRDMPVELVELKPEPRLSGRSVEQILEMESSRVLALLPERHMLYALDEHGQSWTTADLARALELSANTGMDPCFIIGSADGLSPHIKQKARVQISLSRMTLPHGLARMILAEQLYRAAMILKNHPYHRE